MNNIDNVKKAMMRAMMVAFKMGADGKSEYSAAWELSKIVDDLGNEICANVGAAPKSNADMMERIAADPDRFLRGLTIKDRYPRIADRERYTIIKVSPQDKDMGDERIDGVFFEDGKLIWMHGERFKGGKYVSGKEYREVEIPTWVRS